MAVQLHRALCRPGCHCKQQHSSRQLMQATGMLAPRNQPTTQAQPPLPVQAMALLPAVATLLRANPAEFLALQTTLGSRGTGSWWGRLDA